MHKGALRRSLVAFKNKSDCKSNTNAEVKGVASQVIAEKRRREPGNPTVLVTGTAMVWRVPKNGAVLILFSPLCDGGSLCDEFWRCW
jgi:hypothetical protein